MKPSVAKLCLNNLHKYAVQFQDPRMVADDGTIQTFNGLLCDLAPASVCDWRNRFAIDMEADGLYQSALPKSVAVWCGLDWCCVEHHGTRTKRDLVKWLKSQAKGGE